MIVIDSSAFVAIVRHEPERAALFEAIAGARRRLVSAVTYQETSQVIFGRLGGKGLRILDVLFAAIRPEIVPHDELLARMAIEAFQRFGKGIHPRARLNFCDCAAYALSKSTGAPLLFKGDDFRATDIVACLPAAR